MKKLKHILSYTQFLIEKVDVKIDPETGEKTMDKSKISKEKQVQALAKALYNAYVKAMKFKYKTKEKISTMMKNKAPENEIETAQEMIDDQLEKLETTIDDIQDQMMSIAGDNEALRDKAEIWAGEAKTLASKKILDFFDKNIDKLVKKSEKDKKENQKKEKDDDDDIGSTGAF